MTGPHCNEGLYYMFQTETRKQLTLVFMPLQRLSQTGLDKTIHRPILTIDGYRVPVASTVETECTIVQVVRDVLRFGFVRYMASAQQHRGQRLSSARW
jgi:hypothetical protein